ncbi:hypothetical protein GGF32_001979 [Allomyces javanicus]|nr:hypothetical protein GGF32_001979 [Allomyces javanicus]
MSLPSSTFVLLFALALIALAAGSVNAATPVTALDEWNAFTLYGSDEYSVDLPEAGYVLITDAFCSGDRMAVYINDVYNGPLTEPSSTRCDLDVGADPDKALTMSDFAHGARALKAGKSTIKIATINSPWGGGVAYFKIGLGVYTDPDLGARSSYKVITGSGKVASRDAANAACQTAGLVLADATADNWAEVVNAILASGAVQSTDAVVISSWNGNNYGGANLQLNLKTSASGTVTNAGISTLAAPAFPLCQPPPKPAGFAAKAVAASSAPTAKIVQRDGDLAVVGPASKVKHASAICAQALNGGKPAVLSAGKDKELKAAVKLAFAAAGANKQVWIGGLEAPANKPLVLATKGDAKSHAVSAPDAASADKYFLCKA